MPNKKHKQKNNELIQSQKRATITGKINCRNGKHKWIELKSEGMYVCDFCNEVK